jgi:UDP-N-acetylglucosamine 2-epimerase (non-hydrolysing)
MKIISVVGARPNFMKIAPFIRAINNHNQQFNTGFTPTSADAESPLRSDLALSPSPPPSLPPSSSTGQIVHLLVHTGQHYDDRMSKAFFEELMIPEADINLGVGSGTHAEQVGHTMIEFEKVLKAEKPDWVVVVGDVNAILACSVTAKKENIKCCHIEAGLRSGDMSMPEEINRLVADRISDLLLTPDPISSENLRKEGVSESKIKFVGNIMIDTLEANRERAGKMKISEIVERNLIKEKEASGIGRQASGKSSELRAQGSEHGAQSNKGKIPSLEGFGVGSSAQGSGDVYAGLSDFVVMTLHRPSNVDRRDVLEPIVKFITGEVCADRSVIWTIHPRTRKMLESFGLFDSMLSNKNLVLLEPLSYLEMLKLNMEARIMLTDSGGLQEECTVLGTPCLTLRWNTERPVTLREHGGASVLTGNNIDRIRQEYHTALEKPGTPVRPELWDGHTAERCLRAILEYE